MLSKEVAAALPVLFIAHDWLLLPGDLAPKRRRLVRVFIPVAVITLGLLVYRVRLLAGVDASLAKAPVLNVLTQSIVIWRYLLMMVVPAGQAIMHQTHTVTTLADPLGILAALGLLALLAAAYAARRASPLYLLGAVWWFACIAPLQHHRAPRGDGRASRVRGECRSGDGRDRSDRAIDQTSGGVRRPGTAGMDDGPCALLAVCSALTIRRNMVWDSPVSVWEEARRVAPEMWEARYALGDALREAGDCPAAMVEYEAVLQKRPQHREATTNLGVCLGQIGRFPEAESAFRRAIASIRPGLAATPTSPQSRRSRATRSRRATIISGPSSWIPETSTPACSWRGSTKRFFTTTIAPPACARRRARSLPRPPAWRSASSAINSSHAPRGGSGL